MFKLGSEILSEAAEGRADASEGLVDIVGDVERMADICYGFSLAMSTWNRER